MTSPKVLIFYISGTGNSFYIAQKIAHSFDDYGLRYIPDVLKDRVTQAIECDILGFVFPVHFSKPNVTLKHLFESVSTINANYIFAIANGGGLFGATLKNFNQQLQRFGCQLDAGFLIQMPSNHPKVAALQKKGNDSILKEADFKINVIINHIRQNGKTSIPVKPPVIGYLFTNLIFRPLQKRSEKGTLDKDFWLRDTCDLCGLCEACCPVSNITLNTKILIWHHKCINCATCYHLCPKEAIELGKESMERYHHPAIDLRLLHQNKDA